MGYSAPSRPNVILRNILENPAWYTAYTPYQAEISQGRMEALINFQTMICDLTGMEIANASLLDEATAAAEAMTLAKRSAKSRSNVFFVAGDCHPQTIAVLKTRAEPLGIEVRVAHWATEVRSSCSRPTTSACWRNTRAPTGDDPRHGRRRRRRRTRKGALFCVAADLLALTLIEAPGKWNDGMAAPTSSSATRSASACRSASAARTPASSAARTRSSARMPGRLVGVSVDSQGQPAYRLTLQTREQHIRREKATSNICTAQVLLAVMASMYAVYHGPEGLRRIAQRVHRLAAILGAGLTRGGFEVNGAFFDTLLVRGVDAPAIHARARAQQVNLREFNDRDFPGAGKSMVGIALDETTTRADIEQLWRSSASRPTSTRSTGSGGARRAADPAAARAQERRT